MSGFPSFLKKTLKAFRLLLKGEFYLFRKKVESMLRGNLSIATPNVNLEGEGLARESFCIMTFPHTLFLAELISENLKRHGCAVSIEIKNKAKGLNFFDKNLWYIVLCPQVFKTLPPGHRRIAFQLEQSVSSRWFSRRYLTILKKSLAVLDYSLVNLEFLNKKKITYPKTYYLPIGASSSFLLPLTQKKYEVLFYGDSNCPRRLKMLEALKANFNICIVTEIFGEEMHQLIRQSQVVVNIHYYENALLEMPRIQECLSLGVPVVSEGARDQEDYPEIKGAVRFFPMDSIEGMLVAVRDALKNPILPETIQEAVRLGEKRFAFMFDRFLMGLGFLPISAIENLSLPRLLDRGSPDRITLSLPESTSRRRAFEKLRVKDCTIFDGLRRSPGWVGCALSYRALASEALFHGKERIMIMEDDIILPSAFEEKISIVKEFLDLNPDNWDVFFGLSALLNPGTQVIAVENFKGLTFVTLNKAMSMVCNIYNKKSLKILSQWSPEVIKVESNTIDKFLSEQSSLKFVITLPFLVGHREEMDSTLWDFKNSYYVDMILETEEKLKKMLEAFQHSF